jgi:hypothetical protein
MVLVSPETKEDKRINRTHPAELRALIWNGVLYLILGLM